MTSEDHPTRDELTAMAYVDGELDDGARREFEARLLGDPALALEVAEQRRIALLARALQPPEPMDAEWARLEAEWVHKGGSSLGWFLLGAGVLGLLACGIYALAVSQLHVALKVSALAAVAGAALLFLVTLRARLRTLRYDPYTRVKR